MSEVVGVGRPWRCDRSIGGAMPLVPLKMVYFDEVATTGLYYSSCTKYVPICRDSYCSTREKYGV